MSSASSAPALLHIVQPKEISMITRFTTEIWRWMSQTGSKSIPQRVWESRLFSPFPSQDYVLGDQGWLFASKMPAELDLNRQDPVGSRIMSTMDS